MQNSSCSALLRITLGFDRKSCTGLSPSVITLSRVFHFSVVLPYRGPTTPALPEQCGFGLFRVRSPLLTESFIYFLLLWVLRCFSSPRSPQLCWWQAFSLPGCPIRKFRDQGLFAPPPDLSQLITSFIASESQGIHRLPLLTFLIRTCVRVVIFSACSCSLLL